MHIGFWKSRGNPLEGGQVHASSYQCTKHLGAKASSSEKKGVNKKFHGKGHYLRPKELAKGPYFHQYMPLNAPCVNIHREKNQTPPNVNKNKHFLYFQNLEHTSKECATLRDKIEELIPLGHLKNFVKTGRLKSSSPRMCSLTCSPRRALRTNLHRDSSCRQSLSRIHSRDHWLKGTINTIYRGFVGRGSSIIVQKGYIWSLKIVHLVEKRVRIIPSITLTNENFKALDPDQDILWW